MALVRRNEHSGPWQTPFAAIAALGAGLAIGLVTGLIWLFLTPPSVSVEDYSVAVAATYARERLPLLAVERLSAAGLRDPAGVVVQIAKDFRLRHPNRSRDAANVEQLADVLKNRASNTAASTSGDGPPWLLLLAAVIAIAAAVFVVTNRRTRHRTPRAIWDSMPQVRDPELEEVDLVGGMRSALPGEQRPGAEAHKPGRGRRPASGGLTGLKLPTVAGNRREIALRPFVCSYHAGDEPFEDVHPVLDDESNTLVGACGLTAAAKLETSVPARYYAFTAWVHDYLSGEPMRAVGLLSPWASGRKRIPLYDPTLTQATLHRTEQGLRAQMETNSLIVSVEVDDVGFGTARDVPANSYFTILSVRFDVKIKA